MELAADSPPALKEVVDALSRAHEQMTVARAEATQLLSSDAARVGEVLRGAIRGGRFREAITWQNRSALHRGLDSLLRTPSGATDKETRKREMLVARYMQRYCVKNDTIGYFGPVGWGAFTAAAAAIEVRPGPSVISKRTVYFEHWCIDALASKLAEDADLKANLFVRRAPTRCVSKERRSITRSTERLRSPKTWRVC